MKAVLGLAVVLVLSGCWVWEEMRYHAEHRKLLESFVEEGLKEDTIVERLQFGPPDTVVTPTDRRYSPEGMVRAWSIPEDLAQNIYEKLGEHPKTLVYGRRMVDFIYLDERGVIVDFTTFPN